MLLFSSVGAANEEERSYVVESLEKDGLIISNISKKSPNKYLIWVISGSEYKATSNDLAYPNCMQQYWVNRANYCQNPKNIVTTSNVTQIGLFNNKKLDEEESIPYTFKI